MNPLSRCTVGSHATRPDAVQIQFAGQGGDVVPLCVNGHGDARAIRALVRDMLLRVIASARRVAAGNLSAAAVDGLIAAAGLSEPACPQAGPPPSSTLGALRASACSAPLVSQGQGDQRTDLVPSRAGGVPRLRVVRPADLPAASDGVSSSETDQGGSGRAWDSGQSAHRATSGKDARRPSPV